MSYLETKFNILAEESDYLTAFLQQKEKIRQKGPQI